LVLSLVSNKEVMVSKIMERSKTSGRNDCWNFKEKVYYLRR
jgi:hypothetical protein